MQAIIKKTLDHLHEFLNRAEYEQHEIDYRYEHSLRVANIGLDLAVKENANKKVAVIGCILHDLGKFESLKGIDHGRVSAELAKSFLSTLELTQKEIDDICYSIATHVDGKAGFEYEDIIEAKIVTDADNIDRFSSSKILQSKLWELKDEKISVQEKIETLEARIEKFKDYSNKSTMETKTGNILFKEKLELNILFYSSLIQDLEKTREPIWNFE